jgi:DMSO/TMAO reductase YedYZ heme-binding membrane subunit
MSKTFSIILIVLALALIAYNVTLVDFTAPFQGDSTIALIGIMASLCAVVLLLLYLTSKKVQKKLNED